MTLLRAAWPLATLLALSCGQKTAVQDLGGPAMANIAPVTNLYLRNAFDTDPSAYVGRFIQDGLSDLDEAASMTTSCSGFVTYREVGGGNVTYDEVMSASSAAAGRIGVPAIMGVGASAGTTSVVRVHYTLTRKLIGEIQDPDGFRACCLQTEDRCTERYVGEFMEGTGEIYYALGRALDFQGKAAASKVTGEISYHKETAWQQAIQFESPVFFAFKVHQNPVKLEIGCGDWVTRPPKSATAQYFVGISPAMDSESLARSAALRDARLQVVRWLGESLATGTISNVGISGSIQDMQSSLQEDTVVEAAASGVASMVKDENWCIEATPVPGSTRYVAKVLALLPTAQAQQAAEGMLGAMPR